MQYFVSVVSDLELIVYDSVFSLRCQSLFRLGAGPEKISHGGWLSCISTPFVSSPNKYSSICLIIVRANHVDCPRVFGLLEDWWEHTGEWHGKCRSDESIAGPWNMSSQLSILSMGVSLQSLSEAFLQDSCFAAQAVCSVCSSKKCHLLSHRFLGWDNLEGSHRTAHIRCTY